jgi:hypothetical protein
MSEHNINAKKMLEMRMNGATFQEIGDAFGMSKQGAHSIIITYCRQIAGIRGKGFDVNQIKYEGIFNYFLENPGETISSFTFDIFGYYSNKVRDLRNFLIGEHEIYLNIHQIKRICEIVGRPFEEVFKEREINE